jgi:hypothetical protein
MASAAAIGTLGDSRMGSGTLGWAGLCNVSESQSSQRLILFDKAVTISENIHQVGGGGVWCPSECEPEGEVSQGW